MAEPWVLYREGEREREIARQCKLVHAPSLEV